MTREWEQCKSDFEDAGNHAGWFLTALFMGLAGLVIVAGLKAAELHRKAGARKTVRQPLRIAEPRKLRVIREAGL